MSFFSPKTTKLFLKIQQKEITESLIYATLAKTCNDEQNKEILLRLSHDEQGHYEIWKKYTWQDIQPLMRKVRFFSFVARRFWLSFGLKLMEHWEHAAQRAYLWLIYELPLEGMMKEVERILADEEQHEQALLAMINDKVLTYIGSIVLGLNDALVELTWVLAGLTLWLQDTKLIALVGLITGISASFSMWASEYLSTKTEGENNPLTASFYTRVAYIVTVVFLISPFLFITNHFLALFVTLFIVVAIIAVFNWYLSIAKGYAFKQRFFEMIGISIGVALVSFGIWFGVRYLFGIGE